MGWPRCRSGMHRRWLRSGRLRALEARDVREKTASEVTITPRGLGGSASGRRGSPAREDRSPTPRCLLPEGTTYVTPAELPRVLRAEVQVHRIKESRGLSSTRRSATEIRDVVRRGYAPRSRSQALTEPEQSLMSWICPEACGVGGCALRRRGDDGLRRGDHCRRSTFPRVRAAGVEIQRSPGQLLAGSQADHRSHREADQRAAWLDELRSNRSPASRSS